MERIDDSMARIRKDYSIPDCPKIGRYDGLGMAAVPLAIADKERELGISHSSSSNTDWLKGYHEGIKVGKEMEKSSFNKKDYEDGYDLGKQHGYEEGYSKGKNDGEIEAYTEAMKYKERDDIEGFFINAELFIDIYK